MQQVETIRSAISSQQDEELSRALAQVFSEGPSREIVPALCQALLAHWHEQHEDIALVLQELKDPRAVESLALAAEISFAYLLKWGNLAEFQRKCTWALADIGIFAPQGKKVVAATPGVVIYRGELGQGGNVVAVLGPKWRIHYYAHLSSYGNEPLLVSSGSQVGAVGTSGNAAGKPPHLHYTVFSLVPLPWKYSTETQGWRKMFYLDPGAMLKNGA